MEATAQAQPNIALVKYWGKRDPDTNTPAVPSLSITLAALWTRTRVRFRDDLSADTFTLNGVRDPAQEARVSACLERLRRHAGRPQRAEVESTNNFPTGAGLASSASGFAALVSAAAAALDIDASREWLSDQARQSSGSAARSLFGGFVELPVDGPGPAVARPLRPASAWPLRVVIAITSRRAKSVGSTTGMQHTADTSDFYAAWVAGADRDFAAARRAVLDGDFAALARVSEHSCLKMHGLMLSADPGLIYWNGATVECLQRIRALRDSGVPVFFTVDAGPQVKAICEPQACSAVASALREVPGVDEVLASGLGPDARILECRA